MFNETQIIGTITVIAGERKSNNHPQKTPKKTPTKCNLNHVIQSLEYHSFGMIIKNMRPPRKQTKTTWAIVAANNNKLLVCLSVCLSVSKCTSV